MRMQVFSLLTGALVLIPAGSLKADEASKALIEKAVKAYGGAEKLEKVQALRAKVKGTLELAGMDIEFTSNGLTDMSGKHKSEVEVEVMGQKIAIVQVFDGQKGWVKLADSTSDLEGDQLKELRNETHSGRVNLLVPLLKDKAFSLTALGEIKVNGKPALGVKVSAKDYRDIQLYFDKETGLVVKSVRQVLDTTTRQEVTQETYLSAFKETAGIKHATRVVIHREGKKFLEAEVVEWKALDQSNASEFAKP
jgi:hypothetical protein